MTYLERIKRWFSKKTPRAIFDRILIDNPLREFVYLDEVSLRSLLSSKKGEMTASTSNEVSQSVENESKNTTSLGGANIGKLEKISRFQTLNSSTLQTARKATVQSWFRELDKLRDIRLLETVQQVQPFENTQDVLKCSNSSVCVKDEELKRGKIVEFRVRLSTDPIFHLVTLLSEFKGMATDFPDMMGEHGGLEQLAEFEGISLVLQRLLAGLIPVRAEVLDYAVIELENAKYVVHVDAIAKLGIASEPLEIVCVTELDAYWKDIRRVLFSDAEFTILARVSKTGLQTIWTPIKLADLMRGLVPDLSEQLNNATSLLFNPDSPLAAQTDNESALRASLMIYSQCVLDDVDSKISDNEKALIELQIAALEISEQTVLLQKDAFLDVRELLSKIVKVDISPQKDLEFREHARNSAGLPYFKSLQSGAQIAPASTSDNAQKDKFLLDVEVVAMYW